MRDPVAVIRYMDAAGKPAELTLTKDVVVGRLPECDVVLPKATVSRQHARISRKNGRWVVADLGSSHGTFVNRVRIAEHTLGTGDRILVGEETIVFEEAGAATSDAIGVLTEHAIEAGDLMRTVMGTRRMDIAQLGTRPDPSVARTVNIGSGGARPGDTTDKPADGGHTLEMDAEIAGHLLALVKIGDELRRCADVDAIARRSLDIALRATGADRGALALSDDDAPGQFVVRARVAARGSADGIAPSRTFVDRVVSQKVALMALDTGADSDLSSAKSIVAQAIRSILCAPLWDGDAILGWIYLDRVQGGQAFRKQDLDLVTAIGHYAAAEIARHRLTRRVILAETRRAHFARFLSADVIKHVESVGAELSAQEQQVTVLFSDIKGFTSMSEKLDPAGVKRLLDDYFERMTEILLDKYGGTLDKYIGDAIMALFGAPFSKGPADDATRAVGAAVDMRDTIETLSKEKPEYDGFQVRIGINTGRMVAGMLGSRRRLEYSVIGDSVNIASRLESGGEPGRIQIGESTWELVKDAFDCELAGERTLKNRERPVKTYWVKGRR